MQDTATMDPPSIRDSGTPRRLFNFGRVLESELTSTGQKQLVRLRSLLAEDLAQQVVYRCRSIEALAGDQQTKYFAGDSSQDNPELKVMQKRYEQRKVSAALFEKLILKSEGPTNPAAPVSRYPQLDQQITAERWKWLDRFEEDVTLERVTITLDKVVKALTDT